MSVEISTKTNGYKIQNEWAAVLYNDKPSAKRSPTREVWESYSHCWHGTIFSMIEIFIDG